MKKQFLEVGEIVSTHGLRGDVKLYPWSDTVDFITKFKKVYFFEGKKSINIEYAKVHKNIVILKLENIDTVEEAAKLRKSVLYIDRNDIELDEDAFFVQDLIGLDVYDVDTGKLYGKLEDVSFTGANDVYHVSDGKSVFLVPVIPSVVINISLEENKVEIRPIEGLFEATNKEINEKK